MARDVHAYLNLNAYMPYFYICLNVAGPVYILYNFLDDYFYFI